MADVRVGVVGTGFITDRFAAAVRDVAGIRIEAVYSRSAERGTQAAARLGAASAVTSFDDLAGLVDAVYLASPNSVHAEQAERAIDLGLHVLVEKPAVDSVATWQRLVSRAAVRRVVLIEAMRTAYDPGTLLLRDLLPEIGVVRQASLRHISRSSRYDLVLAGEQTNIFDPAMGGGALRDLGVYCVYAMTSMFGMPQQVANAIAVVGSGADGAGAAIAQYDGFAVSLEYSKITSTRLPSEIRGELGTLSVDHLASPRRIELFGHDGASETHVVDEPPNALHGEVERFVELIRNGGDPTPDQAATAVTLEVLEWLERSVG